MSFLKFSEKNFRSAVKLKMSWCKLSTRPPSEKKLFTHESLRYSLTLLKLPKIFTVVYWVAKPLICSEAEGDLVVIEPVPS